MGWWSESIMGGDGPADMECDWRESRIVNEQDVKKFLHENAIKGYHSDPIASQVAAFLSIQEGIPLSDEFRNELIKAARSEDVSAGWHDPKIRLQHIEKLCEDLESYKGLPMTMPAQPGLFQVMEEHMQSGKTGLINAKSVDELSAELVQEIMGQDD